MMTTIVVILIVWVVLSVPVSLLAARMLRGEHHGPDEAARRGLSESHTGRSFH
ncbi:hypothetical protein [Nocardia lasii]|uniref:Uncharacterized protein n=1 Tax=Nocardia lasii TaxID=1616107 RepID=A0ABW1JNI8_9NOCA